MGEHMPPATHLGKAEFVQHLGLGRLVLPLLCQVHHLVNEHASVALLLAHLFQIVAITIRQHFATGKTFHGNNHIQQQQQQASTVRKVQEKNSGSSNSIFLPVCLANLQIPNIRHLPKHIKLANVEPQQQKQDTHVVVHGHAVVEHKLIEPDFQDKAQHVANEEHERHRKHLVADAETGQSKQPLHRYPEFVVQ